MSVEIEKRHTLAVPSDLDEGALDGFYAELEIILEDSPPDVGLDCSLLDHATSGHINMLWEAQTKCEEAGVPVHLLAVRYGLERVLRILDLYDMFSIQQRRGEIQPAACKGYRPDVDIPTFEIGFPATTHGILDALDRFHDFLVRAGLPGGCAFDLEIVFYEVASNIRRHSGLGGADRVEFSAAPGEGSILLRFTDAGRPFDPTFNTPEFNPRRAIEMRQTSGIGLTMIQRLVDSSRYERVDERLNALTLEKRYG
jgi:anti-sigma regulatory factor (Ser/Thr protein kinase)/ABC-type transporter Mla MlaB component